MTGRRSRELLVTKPFPAGLRHKIQQYFITVAILGVALYSSLTGKAHACSTWNGQTGVASWYGPGLQGNETASGEAFDMWAMTAAHPCLPMGTKVRVTVLATGRSLIVTVNDRLPSRRRILDLSKGAARVLGIATQGVTVVQLSPAYPNVFAVW